MLSLRSNTLLVRRTPAARPAARATAVVRAYKGEDAVKGAASKAQSALASVNTDAAKDKVAEFGEELKAAWDKSDEKPAIIVLGIASLIALTAVNGVVSTVDRIPIFSDLMELVGLVVSGFFAYRYLAFKPDREELLRKIDNYLAKILGK